MLVLGHPGAREPEQRREDDRDPEEPVGRVVARLLGQREAEDDERRRGRRGASPASVSRRAQLDPQVLPRRARRRPRGSVMRAPALRGKCHDPLGIVRRDRRQSRSRRVAASSRSRSCAPVLVERRERLVEHEQRRGRGAASGTAPAAGSSRVSTSRPARCRASHNANRSSSIPIRSRRSGTRYSRPKRSRFSSAVSSR